METNDSGWPLGCKQGQFGDMPDVLFAYNRYSKDDVNRIFCNIGSMSFLNNNVYHQAILENVLYK
jgi:hypothetical protein